MELGKVIVFATDAGKKEKSRVKDEVKPQIEGEICLEKCHFVFQNDFVSGNQDTAVHVSLEKLYNCLKKISLPYAILVVNPNTSKKAILAAGQLMRSQNIEPRDLSIGCTAIINKTGIKYKT